VQQHVDVADALGFEPAAAVPPAMRCKVGVQAVEVGGRERLQRDVAQRREDLGLGVDAVGRPGGRADDGPCGRQSLVGEEGSQRQPGRLHEGGIPSELRIGPIDQRAHDLMRELEPWRSTPAMLALRDRLATP
jgi:hypothetical protein